MWTKLRIFLSLLLSIFLLIGSVILTIHLNNIVLEINQNFIDQFGFQLAICIVLYGGFITCLIYSLYSLYIEYKRNQFEQSCKEKK